MFRAAWKSFDTDFKRILDDMKSQKRYIKEWAAALHNEQHQRDSLSLQAHINQYQKDREEILRLVQQYMVDRNRIFSEFDIMQNERTRQKCAEIVEWLGAYPSTSADHDEKCSTREQVHNSGQWILKHEKMENWIDPDLMPPSSILWLTGIMGAGMDICSVSLHFVLLD